jgi:PmbA protein
MKPWEIGEETISVARRLGANDVAVTVTERQENMVRFANDQITVVNTLRELSANVFLCLGRRKATINVLDLSRRGIEKACREAVGMASTMPEASLYAPLPTGPFVYDEVLTRRREAPGGPERTVHWVQEAIEEAKRYGATRTAGSLTAKNVVIHLATSGDARGVAYRPSLELSIRAFGEGLASGHSLSVSPNEKGFDPRNAGREAGELAKAARDPVKGSPGTMDALLGPMVFADVVGQVGRFASAFYVDAGLSFLAGKIGEQVAAESLDLFDDPTDPSALGHSPFDAEGTPSKRKALLEGGVLRTYLHNSSTAAKFEVESTGNAGLITPVPYSLQVGAGRGSLEDLLSQMEQGIYVTNDWYLRYQNYSTGDLSFIPRDAMFLVREGRIVSSLKELRISDNVLGMLQRIKALGGQRRWVRWWEVETPTLTPAALIGGVRFTASSQ